MLWMGFLFLMSNSNDLEELGINIFNVAECRSKSFSSPIINSAY